MTIDKWFLKRSKPIAPCEENHPSTSSSSPACETPSTSYSSQESDHFDFDLGEWIGKSSQMSRVQKVEMMKRCWAPTQSYNFRDNSDDKKRSFIHNWLEIYKPWLVYSKKLKGALCLYCVLFPPIAPRGLLGAFIATAFTRYFEFYSLPPPDQMAGYAHALYDDKMHSAAILINKIQLSACQH